MSYTAAGETTVFSNGCEFVRMGTTQETAAFSRRGVVLAIRESVPDWLARTLRKLEDLAAVEQNWDSYGAEAIDVTAISRAQILISHLAKFVGIDEPAVGATPDGEPGFSWDGGAWSLDVDISPAGTFHYVYICDQDESRDVEASTRQADELLPFLTSW